MTVETMTAEQINKSIIFKTIQDPVFMHRIKVVASITISCEMGMDVEVSPQIYQSIKDNLTLAVMRKIYFDQRKSLRESLVQLGMVNPMEFSKFQDAVGKVMELAKFQPPYGILKEVDL